MKINFEKEVSYVFGKSIFYGDHRIINNDSYFFDIIGSGLSFAVACFLSKFLDIFNIPNRVFTPLEYIDNHFRGIPIIVSYRGKNRDIKAVADILVERETKLCYLLTGFHESPLKQKLSKSGVTIQHFIIPEHKDERRFVALRSTIGLLLTSLNLVMFITNTEFPFSREELISVSQSQRIIANEISAKILEFGHFRNEKWIVLGKGMLDPFSVLLQSIFGESGILSVQIADYRDYLHGKYLAAFQEPKIHLTLLSYPSVNNIVNRIVERFSQNFNILIIPFNDTSFINYFEGVLLLFMISENILNSLGYSLKKPPKPTEMRRWTSWGNLQ